MDKRTGIKQTLLLTGAIIGLLVGSGISTGQEVLQYFTPYGLYAFLVAGVSALIIIIANYGFAYAGFHGNFKKGSEVFAFYCGPVIGKIFDWFTVLFCYMSYIVMVGGGSSTLNEQFGLPIIFGGTIIMVCAGGTVAIGLNSIVNIVARIGVLKVVMVSTVCLVSLICHIESLPQNLSRISSSELPLLKAADTWLFSGISYGGFCILWLASYVATLSTKVDYMTLQRGSVFAAIILVSMCLVIGFALTANIDSVYNLQIPNLFLAKQIWMPLSYFYSMITFLAIYSTACPLLWTASSRFCVEGTVKFKLVTIGLAAAGLLIAMFTPYNILINYIYVLNGYLGSAFLIIMIVRLVMIKMKVRSSQYNTQ